MKLGDGVDYVKFCGMVPNRNNIQLVILVYGHSKFVKKRQRQFDRWLQRTRFDTYERDFDSYDAYRCVDGPESDEDDTVPDYAGPCLVGRGNGSFWEAYNWIRKKKLFSKKMVCPVLRLSHQLLLLYLKKKKKKMLKVRSLDPKKKKKNKWSTARLYNLKKKKKIKKSAAWKSG
ncbi:hypothetical protein BVC80_9095g1 [Macleaya cordata]|uniref:Uncharacterized protein n=1 Tax=Macleaya cordata TaxID=56857 RepID=A0A200PXA5_MACCD|nr:hypothetical protein BVC80_9095g1 [Macleaya cordata]